MYILGRFVVLWSSLLLVGGKLTKESMKLLNWGAKILVIGFASGEVLVIPANIALVKKFHHKNCFFNIDAYSAASVGASTYVVPGLRVSSGFLDSHVIIPLAHSMENEEVLEVDWLESPGFNQEDVSRDKSVAVGACAQLVFAPIEESFADDAFLLPSRFRVIPLDAKTTALMVVLQDPPSTTRTLDLASALEVGGGTRRAANDLSSDHCIPIYI
ncbi:hypothetical protein M5K25_026403 [Dendrobium thyrsiflorum]|uniref:Uncharacterized protein n=1 Tax=Dendrobium thyrsiflorum TaxID=117978 RepID=A0ABD0TX67_DENTH